MSDEKALADQFERYVKARGGKLTPLQAGIADRILMSAGIKAFLGAATGKSYLFGLIEEFAKDCGQAPRSSVLDPTLTKITTGYIPWDVEGQSRCMACDRPFQYPGVSPVQVGGSFYHPGCQPVAWALPLPPPPNMRGVVTGIEVAREMFETAKAAPDPAPVPHGSTTEVTMPQRTTLADMNQEREVDLSCINHHQDRNRDRALHHGRWEIHWSGWIPGWDQDVYKSYYVAWADGRKLEVLSPSPGKVQDYRDGDLIDFGPDAGSILTGRALALGGVAAAERERVRTLNALVDRLDEIDRAEGVTAPAITHKDIADARTALVGAVGHTGPIYNSAGSICPLHPEVVLEGGEACFKCCAWGVPK